MSGEMRDANLDIEEKYFRMLYKGFLIGINLQTYPAFLITNIEMSHYLSECNNSFDKRHSISKMFWI